MPERYGAEMGPQTRHTPRRNTASIMKDLIRYDLKNNARFIVKNTISTTHLKVFRRVFLLFSRLSLQITLSHSSHDL